MLLSCCDGDAIGGEGVVACWDEDVTTVGTHGVRSHYNALVAQADVPCGIEPLALG